MTINDLTTFQLELHNFKSNLAKQFSSIKQSFIAEVLQFKNEKTVVVSGVTVRNDKFNDKGKNVNSLLKWKCEVEKIVFVDNSNITVSMLNYSGLHLNERGTARL